MPLELKSEKIGRGGKITFFFSFASGFLFLSDVALKILHS